MNITHPIRLDMDKKQANPPVLLVQEDSGSRCLAISLYAQGEPWPLPQVQTVLVRYRKADGTGGCYDTLPDGTAAWSVSGNVVTVRIAPQVTAAAGPVKLAVSLVKDDKILSTVSADLLVQGLPAGQDESEPYHYVSAFLPQPKSAQVGQILAVQGVSADGKVLTLGAVTPQAAEPGAKGLSAYEIAVIEGFEGSPAQWLASLRGGDGPMGPAGPQGARGESGYTPIKGLDYWTEADQAGLKGKSAYESYVETGGVLTESQWVASFAQPKTPDFVDSVEAMTDTHKVYALKENGMLYAYGSQTVAGATHTNLFLASQAQWGQRLNSSGTTSAQAGAVTTGAIACGKDSVLRVKGIDFSNSASSKISFYGADGGFINNQSAVSNAHLGMTEENGVATFQLSVAADYYSPLNGGWASVKVSGDAAQGSDIIITVDEEISEGGGTATVTGWFATGLSYAPADYENRIVSLENQGQKQAVKLASLASASENRESRLTALEKGAPAAVPAYWQAAIDGLQDTMTARQAGGPDCFQFVWFSDIHGTGGYPNQNGQGTSATAHLGVVAQAAAEQYDIPLIAISGDLMSQASHTEVSAVHEEFAGLKEMLSVIPAQKLAVTVGNHDGAWGTPVDGVAYLKDIGNASLYNHVFRRQAGNLHRVFGPEGTYFYMDSQPQKIRFIMLNFHTDGDGSNDSHGFAVYNSMKHFVLGTKQLQWLENALDVEEGWGIVLMGHPGLTDEDCKDAVALRNLIAAYNSRSVYSAEVCNLEDTYWGSGKDSPCNTSETVGKNFSAAKGEIIAYFHGHIHKDHIYTEVAACPAIAITTAGGDVRDSDYTVERVPGTATETAMDIVTIDRAARTIYMTRLGAGNDRQVIY